MQVCLLDNAWKMNFKRHAKEKTLENASAMCTTLQQT